VTNKKSSDEAAELYSVYSEDSVSLSGSAYAQSNGSMGQEIENAYTSVSVLVKI